MSVETPATPNACFRVAPLSPCLAAPTAPTAPARVVPPPSWWRRTMPAPAAAGVVGASLLACGAVITVAHAWTEGPKPLAEVSHVIGGLIVALLVVAAVATGTRIRPLSDVVVAAAFSLAAHGASLVIQGAPVGGLLLALAPMVAVLAHVAFLPTPLAAAPHTSDRIDIAWAIAKSRRRTARAAQHAASPSHLAMHA